MVRDQIDRTRIFLESTTGTVFYLLIALLGTIGLLYQGVNAVVLPAANVSDSLWLLGRVSYQLFVLSGVVSLVGVPTLLIAGYVRDDRPSRVLTAGASIWSLSYGLTALFFTDQNVAYAIVDGTPITYRQAFRTSLYTNRALVVVVVVFTVVVALYSVRDWVS